MKKKPNPYSERLTINLTPDQMQRLEALRDTRCRKGKFVSKNDLLREAVNGYLAAQGDLRGSRQAIVRGFEGKVDALDAKIDALTTMFQNFIERVTRKREG
jgi:hypothetical protein